VAELVDAPA